MGSARRITICREGLYYICVAVFIIGGAVLRDRNLLVLLAGILLGPLVVHWRLVGLMLRGLSVRRELPRRICAGDPLTVEILAANQRWRLASWAISVEDAIRREGARPADERTRVEVLFPRLEAGQTRAATYRCHLPRRGRYRFGPLRVSSRFPLGLMQGSFQVKDEDTLIVCPRLGKLTRRWRQLFEAQRRGSQQQHHRRGLTEGDYYGLREWQAGDSRRWIHWRTSAKLGELAVRQFEQPRGRDLALIVDLWQDETPADETRLRTELAVSFAATIVADAAERQSSQLMVALSGERGCFWRTAPASRMMTQEILDELATIGAGAGSQLPQLLAQVLQSRRAGMRIVVVSTRAARWAQLLADAERASSGRLEQPRGGLWIDVSRPQLDEYFELA
ncbi:MAG: DUF58 domain-containing protein [Pirellulaceae bacterium]|nr:DUF58 domain-containing protein [Pirellulaceae bacterium]